MNDKEINLFKEKLKGLSEEAIDSIIEESAKLVDNNFHPQDVFPLGITINPDSVRLKFLSKPDEHENLIEFIVNDPNGPAYSDLKVFPLGIIRNDLIQTELTISAEQ